MAAEYGIRISKPTKDVSSANPEDLVFSSKYKTLKISARGSGTVNSASGGGLATIAHGLGYTPTFLVHVDPGQAGDFMIAPYVPSGIFGTPLVQAYADSTNLYVKATADIQNFTYFMQVGDEDSGREIVGTGTFTDGWTIGKSAGGTLWYGACRFPGFNHTGTVTSASLNLYVASRDGSGEVKSNVWALDHDNWGPFDGSGSNPTAGAKTTAVTAHNTTLNQGEYSGANVTSQVNEILARGGWSSGNAIAFIFWENGGSNGNAYYQLSSIINTNLSVNITTATVADYKYTIFLNQLE